MSLEANEPSREVLRRCQEPRPGSSQEAGTWGMAELELRAGPNLGHLSLASAAREHSRQRVQCRQGPEGREGSAMLENGPLLVSVSHRQTRIQVPALFPRAEVGRVPFPLSLWPRPPDPSLRPEVPLPPQLLTFLSCSQTFS